jgi:hypothetical protein
MHCKPTVQKVLLCTFAVIFFCHQQAKAQTVFELALKKKLDSLFAPMPTPPPAAVIPGRPELYPNDAMQAIMVPAGWGGYGTYVFGGISGEYPEVYKNKADLGTAVGICTGNPVKLVNIAASVNMTDVHRFRDFSGNLIISRKLFAGSSISVGGLQLFADKTQSDAPGYTFFVAFSHAVQTIKSKTEGASKLSYTIGVGNGRFLYKSPKDIAAGKGKYGTAVFGSVSYEIFRHANLSAEWNGMNLGFSFGVRPFKSPLSFGVGVANLTSYSSNKPNMVFSIGYPLSLNR